MTFRVVCDGEEETGGDAIIRLDSDDGPAGLRDPRRLDEAAQPAGLVVATRGLVALDLEVRTGERDLHSGHYGGTP